MLREGAGSLNPENRLIPINVARTLPCGGKNDHVQLLRSGESLEISEFDPVERLRVRAGQMIGGGHLRMGFPGLLMIVVIFVPILISVVVVIFMVIMIVVPVMIVVIAARGTETDLDPPDGAFRSRRHREQNIGAAQ